jgi:hypothetical protein
MNQHNQVGKVTHQKTSLCKKTSASLKEIPSWCLKLVSINTKTLRYIKILDVFVGGNCSYRLKVLHHVSKLVCIDINPSHHLFNALTSYRYGVNLISGDAFNVLMTLAERFDVVFIDPPFFFEDLVVAVIKLIIYRTIRTSITYFKTNWKDFTFIKTCTFYGFNSLFSQKHPPIIFVALYEL